MIAESSQCSEASYRVARLFPASSDGEVLSALAFGSRARAVGFGRRLLLPRIVLFTPVVHVTEFLTVRAALDRRILYTAAKNVNHRNRMQASK